MSEIKPRAKLWAVRIKGVQRDEHAPFLAVAPNANQAAAIIRDVLLETAPKHAEKTLITTLLATGDGVAIKGSGFVVELAGMDKEVPQPIKR